LSIITSPTSTFVARYEKVTGMSDLGLDETHMLLTTKSGA
jgi:hypothetical protein